MRQFYRVYTYDKTTDITSNSVFFHDRENGENYFREVANRNGATIPEEQLMDELVRHENTMALFSATRPFPPCGWLVAFGDETNVYFDVLNFED